VMIGGSDPSHLDVREGPKWVTPVVTEVTAPAAAGQRLTTYELSLQASSPDTWSVYALFGSSDTSALQIPAAFQVPAPFGTHIGGARPEIVQLKPEAEWDSWLGVGRGVGVGRIMTVGVEFDKWDLHTALHCSNGAIFWSEPDKAPVLASSDDADDKPRVVVVRAKCSLPAHRNGQMATTSPKSPWVALTTSD
jgi:hypothetical protein